MRKVILRDHYRVPPFNEYARDLRILNKVLWLYQRDVLSRHCDSEIVLDDEDELKALHGNEELLVYRDSLFFNSLLLDEFVRRARASGKPAQVAFSKDDKAITNHSLNLQDSIVLVGENYRGELYYYPQGYVPAEQLQPLVIDTDPLELGYYHVPDYLVPSGSFVYQVPLKAFIPIENWIHVLLANALFGAMGWARRLLKDSNKLSVKLKILLKAVIERKRLLSSSALVKVGRGCTIDPTAIIQGPTIIGNNVKIEAGVLIVSSIIGNNVNIMQGAQMVVSVVSDGCYIPFRAALYGTSMMENSMVAQNTILQGSVIGRNTFIGGGSVFTDYNLMGNPIRTMHRGMLQDVGMAACGGAVGHDCRIGAGFVVYPGRTIESGCVLPYEGDHAVIDRDIHYHDVEHHTTDRYARHVVLEEDPASGWLWLPHKPSTVLQGPSLTPPVTNIEDLITTADGLENGRDVGEPISAGAAYDNVPHYDASREAGEPISISPAQTGDYSLPIKGRSLSGQHYIVTGPLTEAALDGDSSNRSNNEANGNGQHQSNGVSQPKDNADPSASYAPGDALMNGAVQTNQEARSR